MSSVSIFLSCVTAEFGDLREPIRHELTGSDVEVKIQEDFRSYGAATLQMLDRYIRDCRVLLHLVGQQAGSAPPRASVESLLRDYPDLLPRLPVLDGIAFDLTYTQWEGWLAIYHGKPLFIAIPKATLPQAQAAHLDRLRTEDRHPVTFREAGDVPRLFVRECLSDIQVEHRAGDLARRLFAREQENWPIYAACLTVLLVLGGALVLGLHALGEPVRAAIGSPALGMLAAAVMMIYGGFCLLVIRYVGVLGAGAAPPDTPDRAVYEALRLSLASGGRIAQSYERRLARFLDALDRFLGDAGSPPSGSASRTFRLAKPAWLWTAPAYDRCLKYAILYTVSIILLSWLISGHVGPAEHAIGLPDGLTLKSRAGLLAFPILSMIGLKLTEQLADITKKAILWICSSMIAFLGMFIFKTPIPSIAVCAIILVSDREDDGLELISLFIAMSLFLTIRLVAHLSNNLLIIKLAICMIFLFALPILLQINVVKRNRRRILLPGSALMLLLCLLSPLMASRETWFLSGPIILFLPFLALVNAPFDWVALGATRLLLRKGLELGRAWPLVLAFVDAALATLCVTVLGLVCVLAVQAFDAVAALRGLPPILPLDPLFEGLESSPGNPEFFWLYAMLLSTTIPSVANLVLGGFSLMRGFPGLSKALLLAIPAGQPPLRHDRAVISFILAFHWIGALLLGLGVQAGLIVLVIVYVMPSLGLDLLDVARTLARLDLPAHLLGRLQG